jgi:hypothetical protein
VGETTQKQNSLFHPIYNSVLQITRLSAPPLLLVDISDDRQWFRMGRFQEQIYNGGMHKVNG